MKENRIPFGSDPESFADSSRRIQAITQRVIDPYICRRQRADGVFRRTLCVCGACLAIMVLWVSEGKAQNPSRLNALQGSVKVHYRGRSYDMENISRESEPASIALAKTSTGEARIVCAVGHGVRGKSDVMGNIGGDPGDCVLFLDPVSGQVERTSYHTPRPSHLMSSPDGKYVAMASQDGWVATEKSIDSIQTDGFRYNRRLPPDVAKERLLDVAVGTLRYSIWNAADAVPLWEMRFYGKMQKEGEAAQFQRPWKSYAKLAFPWWAMGEDATRYRGCRIGFSPDSCYFVALDQAHGIHVLRLKDGTQFHCCRASNERAPLFFYFSGSAGQMEVVFDDLTIRHIDLVSGEETVEGSFALPPRAFARLSEVSSYFDEFNFVPLSHPCLLCVLANGEFSIHGLAEWPRPNPFGAIPGFGNGKGISRIEISADQRYLGVAYGQSDYWPKDNGTVLQYEVVDLKAGVITRRLGSAEFLKRRREESHAVEIEPTGDIAACLGDDGDNIIYAEPMDRE